jgi:hypothetical protein
VAPAYLNRTLNTSATKEWGLTNPLTDRPRRRQ